jgi:hypothetical protein
LGDLAVHYPDGTISLVDRSKDIIISGGEVDFRCSPRRLDTNYLNRMRLPSLSNKVGPPFVWIVPV